MIQSERGLLIPPVLDDRTHEDLVKEALALIPKYAPQYTDYDNPSDIGRTLIELFAYLTEHLIYQLNRVPEKNYIAFLKLLGITRDPAFPASTFLTFTARPGGEPATVEKDTQVQTQPAEGQRPIIFETDHDISVLPINLKAVLCIEGTGSSLEYRDLSDDFLKAPAEGIKRPLEKTQNGKLQLCFGFDKKTAEEIRLLFLLSKDLHDWAASSGTSSIKPMWRFSKGNNEPLKWTETEVISDTTQSFTRDGAVHLAAISGWKGESPDEWKSGSVEIVPATGTQPVKKQLNWLGLTIEKASSEAEEDYLVQFHPRSILFNSVAAKNVITTKSEEEWTGDGKANQSFKLKHWPLFKDTSLEKPFSHLTIRVGDGEEHWAQVDYFDLFQKGDTNCYRLNPTSGEISFGNHDPTTGEGDGRRPIGKITASGYRYVADGAAGNVGAGSVRIPVSPVTNIIAVTNLVRASGGKAEEPIEETKSRAPEMLRNRNRAITVDDFEYLAKEVSPNIVQVKCLRPRVHEIDNPPDGDEQGSIWKKGTAWEFANLNRSPGHVNLIVVPDVGRDIKDPWPSPELLESLTRDLDARRDLTASLTVTGPRYLPIKVTVDFFVWKSAKVSGQFHDESEIKIIIRNKIKTFLHPINGGNNRNGWNIGQHCFASDLFNFIYSSMPKSLGYIKSISISAGIPKYHDRHYIARRAGGYFEFHQNPKIPSSIFLNNIKWRFVRSVRNARQTRVDSTLQKTIHKLCDDLNKYIKEDSAEEELKNCNYIHDAATEKLVIVFKDVGEAGNEFKLAAEEDSHASVSDETLTGGLGGEFDDNKHRPIKLSEWGQTVLLVDYELVCAADDEHLVVNVEVEGEVTHD